MDMRSSLAQPYHSTGDDAGRTGFDCSAVGVYAGVDLRCPF